MLEVESCWYRISAKAIILNEKGEFLLCKENTWFWDLPWWWLDHWENPHNCIIRELKEEMGLDVIEIEDNPSYFVTFHKPSSKTRPWIANICYKVKTKNLDFIPSDECIDIWFFSPGDTENSDALDNVKILAKQMLLK